MLSGLYNKLIFLWLFEIRSLVGRGSGYSQLLEEPYASKQNTRLICYFYLL
jgi:hypothetical protein